MGGGIDFVHCANTAKLEDEILQSYAKHFRSFISVNLCPCTCTTYSKGCLSLEQKVCEKISRD